MSNYWREPIAEPARKLSDAEGAPWLFAGLAVFWLLVIAGIAWL